MKDKESKQVTVERLAAERAARSTAEQIKELDARVGADGAKKERARLLARENAVQEARAQAAALAAAKKPKKDK